MIIIHATEHTGPPAFRSRGIHVVQRIGLIPSRLARRVSAPIAPSPDFEAQARIQPIFLAKRPGHARCYACHAGSGSNAYLQKLSPGAAEWDEAQSRKNFEAIKRLIPPGAPEKSRLLTRPLDERAGGDEFHGGGKHWASRDNSEWQTLAAWIRGETPATAASADANRHVRIVQTNSAGDSVHLIDPATNTVVAGSRASKRTTAPRLRRRQPSTSPTKPRARSTSSDADAEGRHTHPAQRPSQQPVDLA